MVFIASLASLIFVILLVPEYFRFAGQTEYTWLVASRLGLAFAVMMSVVGMRLFPSWGDEFVFLAQILIPPGLTLFDYIKGGEPVYDGNMMMTILVLYIFVPNRLIYSTTAGLCAAFIASTNLTLLHDIETGKLIPMIVMLCVANLFGFIAMQRFNLVRRKEYSTYLTERAGREELRAEVEKRMATEDGLRLALSEADAATRLKSGALDDLSHELRTPLNAIIGYSESIREEVFGPLENAQYRDYAQIIHDSGNHLLNLITSMLDHSKAESGAIKLNEDIVDVEGMVNGILPMVGSLAREADVKVSAKSLAAVPSIRVDEQKIRQILLNLLSNAIKFTPAGGSVELLVDVPADNSVVFAVRDTGVGIPDRDLDKVFKPFEQSMAHGLRGESGTGLGLPLSKKLAELHGGQITVESRVNEGSVFSLILPEGRNVPLQSEEALAS